MHGTGVCTSCGAAEVETNNDGACADCDPDSEGAKHPMDDDEDSDAPIETGSDEGDESQW